MKFQADSSHSVSDSREEKDRERAGEERRLPDDSAQEGEEGTCPCQSQIHLAFT